MVKAWELNSTSSTWEPLGIPIYGVATDDQLNLVAMSRDGQVLAAGARRNDANSLFDSGHVRTFRWNGTDWEPYGQEVSGLWSFCEFAVYRSHSELNACFPISDQG